jgi:hypothetical protein
LRGAGLDEPGGCREDAGEPATKQNAFHTKISFGFIDQVANPAT